MSQLLHICYSYYSLCISHIVTIISIFKSLPQSFTDHIIAIKLLHTVLWALACLQLLSCPFTTAIELHFTNICNADKLEKIFDVWLPLTPMTVMSLAAASVYWIVGKHLLLPWSSPSESSRLLHLAKPVCFSIYSADCGIPL